MYGVLSGRAYWKPPPITAPTRFEPCHTVRLADRVFVLHAFQEKSKSGAAMRKAQIDLIGQRLKQAIEIRKKKE